jgi:16S rRNA (cytidine1402-2'-O)-methyltransferase
LKAVIGDVFTPINKELQLKNNLKNTIFMNQGTLYLIPNFLGEGSKNDIPINHLKQIYTLNTFIVESEKSARSYLKVIEHPLPQSEFTFHLLNEHSQIKEDLTPYFKNCLKGESLGLLSDAGIPCVADPGNRAVAFAHRNKITVKPLSGPSSIYMALMASGFNGQHFAFHGYIPVENPERLKKIRNMEQSFLSTGQTQIFMETPYRNEKLLHQLLGTLKPKTKLCVAVNISLPNEEIISKEIAVWKTEDIDVNKQPAIFLIGN